MSLVRVHNEWDPLEEMIVGVARGARVPSADPGLFAVDYVNVLDAPESIPTGPYPPEIVDQAEEDLDRFSTVLADAGVTVRRPTPSDHARPFGTPDWSTDGEYDYCPRDVLLPIGTTIIETPMVLRSRFFEPLAYRDILLEYFESGANWLSAPKPRLADEMYDAEAPDGVVLRDLEPAFDAANVLRFGQDILYLVSSSGNVSGSRWLQRVLGEPYRVHTLEGSYTGTHIDTTIAPVRPGLVVLNPERIRPDQVPSFMDKWDLIWSPEMVDTGWVGPYPRASIWQGMNFIMINPELAVINELQTPLIHELEAHGVDVIPLPMRQARTLSGGFHCVSVDIRRRGQLEDYS